MTRAICPRRRSFIAAILVVLMVLPLFLAVPGTARAARPEREWQGVDEAVVERIAKEHHREARPSLFAAGRGDLGLFAFLLAGACGGFAAGYFWRRLVDGRSSCGKHGAAGCKESSSTNKDATHA